MKIMSSTDVDSSGVIVCLKKTSRDQEFAVSTSNRGLIFGSVTASSWFFTTTYTINFSNEKYYEKIFISGVVEM